MTAERVQTVVVGAGPAGLATAAELARAGVECVVLEQGDGVAAAWRGLYPTLTLHTGKLLSAQRGMRFASAVPTFPTRDDLVTYLERYRERGRITVRTRCRVERATRLVDRWRVELDVRGARRTIECRALVAAAGTISRPYVPPLPGAAGYRGERFHSVAYQTSEPLRGRRALVVGSGNSAAEIAVEAAAAGASVELAVRSGAHVVPRTVCGVPVQYFAFVLQRSPISTRLREALATVFGSLARLRGGPPLPRPQRSLLDSVPVLARGLAPAIREGRIRVRAALAAFETRHVVLADGARERYDVVVIATGFRPALDFLGPAAPRSRDGEPERPRGVRSPTAPGLFFVGYRQDSIGTLWNIRADSRAAARAIAAVAARARRRRSRARPR